MRILFPCSIQYRHLISGFLIVGALAAPAFFASAQTLTAPETGAPLPQIAAALEDLSRLTGQAVATEDQARALCDQERYLADCAQIGKRHNLYDREELSHVDTLLSEITGSIVEDLKQCRDEACIVEVATRVAQSIARRNPSAARRFDLTPAKVEEKKEIQSVAQEIGVSAEQCRAMDPDTAPLELLRLCARLAKDERIQQYIPEEVKQTNQQTDTTIALRTALAGDALQCGDNTLEGCGNFCLNPSEEARAQGSAAIPAVCRDIAQRFFGPDGIKQLESSYQQVRRVEEFYRKKTENAIFTTADGQTLTNPADIGQYLEDEAAKGNVEAVERGMDFMIEQGFAKPADKEFTLRIVRKVRERGGIASFEACRQNPRLCRDYIPDDQKEHFDASDQIDEIMRREIGFDPAECRRGESDHTIGNRCFEGARRALPKLETIAQRSSRTAAIVEDIRRRVQEGDERIAKQDEFRTSLQQEGGPGGCRREEECRSYCADPTHGPECIAFGAKNNITGFRGEDAVKRFQEFERTLREPQYPYRDGERERALETRDFRTSETTTSSSQDPGRFGREQSPECFAAIEQGDFVRAKEVCSVPRTAVRIRSTDPVCAQISPLPCQEGYYRQAERDREFCPVYGECVQIPGYQPEKRILCPALYSVESCPAGQQRTLSYSSPECGTFYSCEDIKSIGTICPALPTVDSCPAGQHKTVTFSSRECGIYYGCTPDTGTGDISFPYTFSDGRRVASREEARAYCNQYGPGSGQAIAAECEAKFGVVYTRLCSSGQYWFVQFEGGPGYCRSNTDQTSGDSACQELESLIPGCHTMTESPQARFNTAMDRYVIVGTRTIKNCASERIPGCYYSGDTSGDSACQELGTLIPGCHTMSESPQARFNTAMTQYVIVGTRTVKNCSSERIPGCFYSGDTTSWPGDANSCPGFAYSRYDASGRRYCQLNATRSCDSNYPSYLTNGPNYKPENCPAGDTGPGTASGCGQYVTQTTCPTSSCSWQNNACTSTGTGGGGGGSSSCNTYASQSTCVAASSGSSCQWNAPTNFPAYCSMIYAGDSGSCPGFAYTRYDSSGRRYCQLNNASACEYNYPDYLRIENYFAADCPSATTVGGSACSDGRDNDGDGRVDYPVDTGCYGPSDTDESFPCPGGYRALEVLASGSPGHCQSTTNSAQCQPPGGGSVYACPTGGTSVAGSPSAPSALSASVASNGTDINLVWNDTSANETEFKIWRKAGASGWAFHSTVPATATGPSTGTIRHTDPNVPAGTAEYMVQACNSAGCSFDSNSSSVTIGGGTPPTTGTTACSDGRDNDGDALIDYPSDTGCYGREDNDEAYTGTSTGTGQCSDGRDNDGDGRVDYPADSGCLTAADDDESFPCPNGYRAVEASSTTGSSYCQSTTDSSQCQQPGGGSVYTCPGTSTGGTGGTGTTACSDGRDNDGDGLVDYPADTGCYGRDDQDEAVPTATGSSCPSFAHDMGGYCMLNTDTTRCAEYANASSETTYTNTVCQQRSGSTTTTGTTGTATTCPSGQYWSGTACVTSSTPTTTTCPTGQYWSGTACVTSTTTSGAGAETCGNGFCGSAETSATCPADCGSAAPTPSSTTCPSGQYWSGTACVTSTTTTSPSSGGTPTCPTGETWNGTTCVHTRNRTAHFFAQILTTARWFINGFQIR